MTIHTLEEKFSQTFHTVEHEQNVAQAVALMSARQVSALMVFEKEVPCGIFTEKDLVRSHILFPDKPIGEICIKDVMRTELVVAKPEDRIDDAMAMMIKARIRHLPVISGTRVIGIVCLEDLVQTHVDILTQELHYLKDYINDLQDAAHD